MNWAFLYVAAVYGVIVVLLRRYDERMRVWAACLFYALVLGFLFSVLTTHVVNVPANFLSQLPPWSAVLPSGEVPNAVTNDVILQFVPWSHQVREAWMSLHVPLWNAATGGGYPLLANAQSGALSPLRLAALPVDLGTSFAVEAAFKLLLALTFAYLWARRRDFSEAAAVVMAVCYGFSTGIVTWLHFPHTAVTALLPMTFYAIDRVIDRGDRRDLILVTITFTMALLSGHPESAAHVLSTGGAWFAFAAWVEKRGDWRKAMGQLAIASVLALMLASPFLLPFVEALPLSHRVDALKNGLDTTPVHRSPDLLVLMMHPRFFGDAGGRVWGPVHPEFMNGSVGMLGIAGWLAALFYVIGARKWRNRLSFFALAVPVGLAAVFSIPPVSTFFETIPPFSLAANSRLRMIVCWFLAVCAGAMIDLVREGRIRICAAAASSTFVLLLVSFVSFDVLKYDYRIVAVATAIPGLLAIVSVFLFALDRRWRPLGGFVVVACVLFELWPVGHAWNPTVPAGEVYPRTPLIERLEETLREDPIGPARVAGLGAALFPNSAGMYGFEDIRAHDPMALARTLGMLRVFTGYTSDEYFAHLERFDHPFLDFMNVRYLVTADQQEIVDSGFEEIYRGLDGRIYRNNEALPRFTIADEVVVDPERRHRIRRLVDLEDWAGTAIVGSLPRDVSGEVSVDRLDISVTRGDAYRLHIEAGGPRLVVSSLPWFPGWTVSVDGIVEAPVRVNEGFIGFVVPEGSTEVDVAYRPRSFTIGVALFAVGLIIVAIIAIGPAILRRRGMSTAGTNLMLVLVILIGSVSGCSDHADAIQYPGARRLEEQEEILKRAHFLLNPDATEGPPITILESDDSVERVAEYYARLYGIPRVGEDTFNDFSATLPPAYYREGDLGSDIRLYSDIVRALGLPFDPDSIEGSYRGALIRSSGHLPTITIQRPYIELSTGAIVDRTVILISRW